jgi:tRNA(Arg) A34 adenosine deaminase TadA
VQAYGRVRTNMPPAALPQVHRLAQANCRIMAGKMGAVLAFPELEAGWQAALEQAWDAYRAGSAPVGAAYAAPSGQVLWRGRNRVGEHEAPLGHLCGTRVAHAEIDVLLQAPADSFADMAHGRLYTTLEPCPMCFGAAVMSGVRDIRFGARDLWAGAANLAAASPYLAKKAMRLTGPDPLLQAVSLVLMTEFTLRRGAPRAVEVAAAFRAQDPAAADLAERWLASGRLLRAAREGQSAAQLCEAIWQDLAPTPWTG